VDETPCWGRDFPSGRARRRCLQECTGSTSHAPTTFADTDRTSRRPGGTPGLPCSRAVGAARGRSRRETGRVRRRVDEDVGERGCGVSDVLCASTDLSFSPPPVPNASSSARTSRASARADDRSSWPGTEPARRRSSRSVLSLRVGGWSHGSASSAGGMTSKRSSSCT
jgi:hypothetical protein